MLVFGSATADNVVNFQTAINLNGAARSIHVVDNVNSNNDHAMLSGQLTGNASSGITKVGNGTLVLSNSNNTYEGATTVSSGTLLVNGTNSGNGNVSVATSATLGGSGSLGTSSINVSGILSPGNSIESLSGGALTMIGGSTFEFEALNSSSTGADLMVVNGVLSLTDVTLDLSGANLEANTWSFNDRLTLISYAGPSITSGFVGYDNDGIYTFGTNQWQIKYDNSMKGNNFIGEATGSNFVTLTLVPEPSSLAMLAFGAIALWLFRRKQG
jgi:autotransporter-associated beta strand protein